jgi:hypothetical protein
MRRRPLWFLAGAVVMIGLVIGVWQVNANASAPREAPEAE